MNNINQNKNKCDNEVARFFKLPNKGDNSKTVQFKINVLAKKILGLLSC